MFFIESDTYSTFSSILLLSSWSPGTGGGGGGRLDCWRDGLPYPVELEPDKRALRCGLCCWDRSADNVVGTADVGNWKLGGLTDGAGSAGGGGIPIFLEDGIFFRVAGFLGVGGTGGGGGGAEGGLEGGRGWLCPGITRGTPWEWLAMFPGQAENWL